MTCHHKRGDTSCSTQFPEYHRQNVPTPKSPDVENYDIEEIIQCGSRIVVRVKYPNCAACAYEGNKVLVYENVTTLQMVKWRRIDPHFADLRLKRTEREAPSPIARFPASQDGWNAAMWFANNCPKVLHTK